MRKLGDRRTGSLHPATSRPSVAYAETPGGSQPPSAGKHLPVVAAAVIAAGALVAAIATPGAHAAAAPTAAFSFTPTAPLSAQTVKFTSTSTAAGSGNAITDHKWDLDGNGTFETDTKTTKTVSHAYSLPGPVKVSLRVTDKAGKTATTAKTLTIGDRAPVASFTYSPASPLVNQPVQFTSTATDPEGQISDLAWDLNGDGTYDNGGGSTTLRTFDRAGSYVVGLRVTDAQGKVTFSSQAIAVGMPGSVSATSFPLMSPFPLVRIAGRITSRGTRVRLLRIDAPKGAKVSIRCSGRGCPFGKKVRIARAPEARTARLVRVRPLERLLRPGVRVRIFVTRRDSIGKYTRFRIRRSRSPARADRCMTPGSWRPVRCPG
jgi:PKD repeat protein